MADVTLVDLVKITASTTGAGAVTLGAPVPGYRGVEALLNGAVYSYAIQQEAEYEVGTGTYLSAGQQFIRTPTVSSDGGTAIDLQPNAAIAFVATAQDILGRDVLRPLYGYGEPFNDTGILGQTYTDLTGPIVLYGPKTNAGWGSGVVLSGSDGDRGPAGPADNTYSSYAALQASDPSRKSARLVGDTDTNPRPDGPYSNPTGVAGAWIAQPSDGVTFQQTGTAAPVRTIRAKSLETVSINDFGGLGNNTLDNTAALRAAILELCKRGGGRVRFGSAATYYFAGTVFVPSNIHIDGCGETLRGAGGDLFQTGYYDGSAVFSNVNDGNEINIVQNSSIRNMNVKNAFRVFNMKNWNQECVIADIQTRDCLVVGYYKRCFSASFINITARGSSSIASPTHHFDQQTNSVLLERIKCVTEYGFRFTSGANVVDLVGCEAEGGTNGFVFEGDCLNMTVRGGYYEALGGTLFDFSKAGACSVYFQGNYINGVRVCFDDGGVNTTATLAGTWLPDNERVNSTGNGFTNLMYISGSRDFIEWNDRAVDDPSLSNGVGWVQGAASRYRREQRWNADGKADIRAASLHHGSGVIPQVYGGNSGTPFPGTLPFHSYTLVAGASVAATITTNILLQNNASAVLFVISISDNTGMKKISGVVYGDYVDQRQGTDRPVTVSQNAQGMLVLTVGAINNGNGAVTLTGTIRIL